MNPTITTTNKGGSGAATLAALVQSAAEEARREHGPVLVSSTRRIDWHGPIGFFSRGASIAQDRVYWEQPGTGWALAGVGAAHTFTATGSGRFRNVEAAWRKLIGGATTHYENGAEGQSGPLLLGGFSFDPQSQPNGTWTGFPEALMILPRYMLRSTTSASWLTTNLILWPDSDPEAELARAAADVAVLLDSSPEPRDVPVKLRLEDALPAEHWEKIIRATTQAIREGSLEKVVLGREVRVTSDAPFDLGLALRRLRRGYPDCFVFAVARGGRCFLGASPERLVSAANGEVRVTCLAGSIRRGRTPDEDLQLGRSLMESAKNRHEHEVVARTLRAALEQVCTNVQAPAEPTLLKLRNVQHLYTPMRGRLNAETPLLDVVEQLHPTPAVGGSPRPAALHLIRAIEGMDRGWWAAPVGWLDAAGQGEFAVALRSGLVSGNQAHLFAGCGIMADSDPAAEYEESRLKLRPMIAALGGS